MALGAALVTLAGSGFSDDGADANAGRAIQGIVTGIGFLGAGVIVKREGHGRVHGLTTAAAIWVTAALGIVCGLGAYRPLALGTAFLLATLLVGGLVDRAIDDRRRRANDGGTGHDGAA